MIKCKLCGGEFKGLELHLAACLKKHSITREMYDELDSDPTLTDGSEEPVTTSSTKPEHVVSQAQIIERALSVEHRDPDRPLSKALAEFDITEHEFISLLKQWKGEGSVPLTMRLKQKMNVGEDIAEELKDQTSAEVTNLEAAEVLVTKYGFTCTDVRSPKGSTPKTWVLKK